MTAGYLESLTNRLMEGVARLPQETRQRHIGYLRSAQNADGGFSGREGGSDLYYTGFGLRGLAVLQALTGTIAVLAMNSRTCPKFTVKIPAPKLTPFIHTKGEMRVYIR